MDWRTRIESIVGPRHLSSDPGVLKKAASATFAAGHRYQASVEPGNTGEVQAIVRIAQEYSLKLYPLSGGRNWGYGSRAPTADHAVMLDLTRLDRIRAFDDSLASVIVEPGVTFAKLDRFLCDQGSRSFLNAPGIGGRASVVGNSLERGIIPGTLGERTGKILGFEAVLADGSLVRTGIGLGQDRHATVREGTPAGADLHGLFSQATGMIVTAIAHRLETFAPYWRHVVFRLNSLDQLAGIIEPLRDLMVEASLTTTTSLINDYRQIARTARRPEPGQNTALSDAMRQQLAVRAGAVAWLGRTAIRAGSMNILLALEDRVRECLAPSSASLTFEPICDAGPIFGRTDDADLSAAYWASAQPAGDNPDDDCGIIWFACHVPMIGHQIQQQIAVTEQVLAEFGFEPGITIHAVDATLAQLVTSITYQRPDGDQRAQACFDALLTRSIDHGSHPYRLPVTAMAHQMRQIRTGDGELLSRLQHAIDPEGIIAAGHYDCRSPKS